MASEVIGHPGFWLTTRPQELEAARSQRRDGRYLSSSFAMVFFLECGIACSDFRCFPITAFFYMYMYLLYSTLRSEARLRTSKVDKSSLGSVI
ncbi:hypothetical protein BJX64DRAFT_167733 [Aspergillus heterothallicus]